MSEWDEVAESMAAPYRDWLGDVTVPSILAARHYVQGMMPDESYQIVSNVADSLHRMTLH
jgi:hypothetical protein